MVRSQQLKETDPIFAAFVSVRQAANEIIARARGNEFSLAAIKLFHSGRASCAGKRAAIAR